MRLHTLLILTALSLGCAKNSAPEEAAAESELAETEPAEAAPEQAVPVEDIPEVIERSQASPPTLIRPTPGSMPIADPQEAYRQCQARVEGPGQEGECSSDADCQTAGCSSEMCVGKATASAGIHSTCEVLPCFSVLESCGCIEGRCSWTVATGSAEEDEN